YPQYKITTANELYLPVGRTASFTLRTEDVIHSFWIPQLAGKRDVVHKERPNYMWFTPDSAGAWNGFCRVLRHVAFEHALPRVYGEPGAIRGVGQASADWPGVPGCDRRSAARHQQEG